MAHGSLGPGFMRGCYLQSKFLSGKGLCGKFFQAWVHKGLLFVSQAKLIYEGSCGASILNICN